MRAPLARASAATSCSAWSFAPSGPTAYTRSIPWSSLLLSHAATRAPAGAARGASSSWPLVRSMPVSIAHR